MAGFYIGREVDPATGGLGDRVELDPSDLLTHGLIVGMTGSGKTGLGIVLIEEALRSGIPVLAIDPKGDVANLLLLFEGLEPAAFAEWVDAEAARRDGRDAASAGAAAAAAWRQGQAEWGLGPADVAALRRAHEAVVYTPGSRAGLRLNVLQSLEAPEGPFDAAPEERREEIGAIVSGLLGLLQRETDPLRSKEAVFLSAVIESAWQAGRDLTLEGLVREVSDPPFKSLGALPLESAFPRAERQQLAVSLNNLLASPQFEDWRHGDALDVERLLRATDGRPRLSIVSTAHLGEHERLFVTALVLERVKAWMRRQSGTSRLRALVYVDEIYGYFPPHPEDPPPKRPLLTLLKQARAQGLGVVLATQNPVDLDYKGLANTGVWLVGRLQTAQDRARLREGLLAAGMDAARLDQLLDATRKRVFLLHDVHRPRAVLLHSRFSLSFLRGPLTREEIARLMAGRGPATSAAPRPAETPGPSPAGAPFHSAFHRLRGGSEAEPYLLVKYAVRYKGQDEQVALRAWPLGPSVGEVLESEPLALDEGTLAEMAPPGLRFGELPAYMTSPGAERAVERVLKDRLPEKLTGTAWYDPVTRALSQPGEEAAAFAVRLRSSRPDDDKLVARIEKTRRALERAEQELSGRKTETWAAVGTAILSNLGLFRGRKRTVSGAGNVLTKNRMENAAEARVAELRAQLAALEAEQAQASAVDPARFEPRTVAPVRSGLSILRYGLLWVY